MQKTDGWKVIEPKVFYSTYGYIEGQKIDLGIAGEYESRE